MKTTLINKTLNMSYLDSILDSFVSKNSQAQTHDMVFAILPPFDKGDNWKNLKPYRLIYVGSDGEFVALAQFLEHIGMQCINRNSGAINGFDFVFVIPDDSLYELYPEQLSDYSAQLESVKALFKR